MFSPILFIEQIGVMMYKNWVPCMYEGWDGNFGLMFRSHPLYINVIEILVPCMFTFTSRIEIFTPICSHIF
jgi:hypothetical protein